MSKVLQFWESQAKKHGASDLATAPDHYYRQLEIREIISALKRHGAGPHVLDIGCGNGYSTAAFAKKFPKWSFQGEDYSPAMIKAARKAKHPKNVRFDVGDVRRIATTDDYYDTIICTRVLINLKNWKAQAAAVKEMRRVLKPGGVLVLVENSQEGLKHLNSLRKAVGLPAIQVRWHNHYMPLFKLWGLTEKLFEDVSYANIGGIYYLLSRVLYARLEADKNRVPRYNHRINEIASQLPALGFWHSSPNFLMVLRKH